MPDAGGLVRGVAWWCDKPEYVPQLCYYETGAYRMAYCTLSLCVADPVLPDRVGETTVGNARTFVWARDAGELEDGVFDVAEYRARAGRW
jgi:hypothetical protein